MRYSQRADCLLQGRELCKDKKPDDLVFTNSKNGMLEPDNLVHRHLKPALAKAGITEGGMHAFQAALNGHHKSKSAKPWKRPD